MPRRTTTEARAHPCDGRAALIFVRHACNWASCSPVPDAGALLERLGRGEEARADYTRAIELDASAALSHNARCAASLQRARLRFGQGASAGQGLPITGPDSAAHRGLLLERMGSTADAAADFDAAVALEPTSAAFVRTGACATAAAASWAPPSPASRARCSWRRATPPRWRAAGGQDDAVLQSTPCCVDLIS